MGNTICINKFYENWKKLDAQLLKGINWRYWETYLHNKHISNMFVLRTWVSYVYIYPIWLTSKVNYHNSSYVSSKEHQPEEGCFYITFRIHKTQMNYWKRIQRMYANFVRPIENGISLMAYSLHSTELYHALMLGLNSTKI